MSGWDGSPTRSILDLQLEPQTQEQRLFHAALAGNMLGERWCQHCNRVGQARLVPDYDAWLCCRCTKITNGLEWWDQTCPECRRKRKEEGGETCFRCRVASVGFNWHGGGFGYGRNNFSERTNAEFVAEHVGDVSDPNVKHIGSLDWKDI